MARVIPRCRTRGRAHRHLRPVACSRRGAGPTVGAGVIGCASFAQMRYDCRRLGYGSRYRCPMHRSLGEEAE